MGDDPEGNWRSECQGEEVTCLLAGGHQRAAAARERASLRSRSGARRHGPPLLARGARTDRGWWPTPAGRKARYSGPGALRYAIGQEATSVLDPQAAPAAIALVLAPNPAHGGPATVAFSLTKSEAVTQVLYDTAGRCVATRPPQAMTVLTSWPGTPSSSLGRLLPAARNGVWNEHRM